MRLFYVFCWSSVDTEVRAAAGALKNLSVDEENKAEITKEDGLRALLKLLTHPDPTVVDRAAECIGNFALDTASQRVLPAHFKGDF